MPWIVAPRSTNNLPRICLTAVHNSSITTAYLLRTYNHRYYADVPLFVTRYNEGAEKLRIWQTTRATSAAPFFFKAMVADVGGERKEFKDGGIRENNPSVAAWNEIISLYGENRNPALLLSVGTGRPNMEKDGFASVWPGPFGRLSVVKKFAETFAVLKNMLVKYTEGEGRHEAMAHLARGEHTWYKRLNVSQGLENMRLDNWEKNTEVDPITKKTRQVPGGKSLRRMEEATKLYLTRPVDPKLKEYAAPQVMLQQVAEKLVRHRRARERTARYDPERWASFTGQKLREYRKPRAGPVDSGTGTGAQASMESSAEAQPLPNGSASVPSGIVDENTTNLSGFSSPLRTELSSSQIHEGEEEPPSAVGDSTDFASPPLESNLEASTSAGASPSP
jgi:hypothetical protein